MGFIDNFKAKAAGWLLTRQEQTSNKLYQSLFSFVNGLLFNIPDNLISYVQNGYMGNPDVYTCVNYKATKIGSVPFTVYKITDKKKFLKYKKAIGKKGYAMQDLAFLKSVLLKNESMEEVDGTELNKLLERPNEVVGQQQFHEAFSSFLDITGNTFVYKLIPDTGFKKGLPTKVYMMPPQYIQIIGGGAEMPVRAYKLIIGAQQIDFSYDEVCHTKLFNPNYSWSGNELFGMSPLKPLIETVGSANEGIRSKYKAFQNSGAIGLISNKDPNAIMSVEEMSQLQELIHTKLGGVDNARAITATNGIVNYQQIGMSPVDLAILDSLKYDSSVIAKAFGLDPIIFSLDNSTYNNKETAAKKAVSDALIPRLNLIRDFWNDIASYYSKVDGVEYYIDYNVGVLPEMAKDLVALIGVLEKCSFIKQNEKRVMIGMDEDEDNSLMNEYLVPQGLVPLSELGVNIDDAINNDTYA